MKRKNIFLSLILASLVSSPFAPSRLAFGKDNTAELKKEIETLKAEVQQLKNARNSEALEPDNDSQNSNISGYSTANTWDPFAEMQQMQDRMNRLFRESFSHAGAMGAFSNPGAGTTAFYEPDLDIQDLKDHYLMTLDLPGMEKDKINVEVTDHDIVVSGERNFQEESKDSRQGFYRMERRFGSFSRRLPLPEDASSEGVNADYSNGVLKIKIPKQTTPKNKEASKQVKIL